MKDEAVKQSPTGAVRLAELAQLFENMLARDDLEEILGQLQQWEYLTVGRPGEWRAWTRLNELLDKQGLPDCSLSIYSNVQSTAGHTVEIRDRDTHQTLAHVDAQWLDREILTLEGRPIAVEWSDGEAMWVAPYRGQDETDSLSYRSERPLLSHELAATLPLQLGLRPGTAPFIAAHDPDGAGSGWWWFHWLGDLYGRALLDLLRYRIPAGETTQPGLCVYVPDEPQAPPSWTKAQVLRYVEDNYRKLEPLLSLGPYHHLLPIRLRRYAVVEQFDIPLFLEATTALRPAVAPEPLSDELAALLR